MKRYVQFFEESSGMSWQNGKMVEVPKELIEGLGSDSVFILDARNTLETSIDDAFTRAKRLSKVRDFIGFKIMQSTNGRFTNNDKALTNLIKL